MKCEHELIGQKNKCSIYQCECPKRKEYCMVKAKRTLKVGESVK